MESQQTMCQKIQKFRWVINLFAHIQQCKSAENQILRQSLTATGAAAAVANAANDRQSRHLVDFGEARHVDRGGGGAL